MRTAERLALACRLHHEACATGLRLYAAVFNARRAGAETQRLRRVLETSNRRIDRRYEAVKASQAAMGSHRSRSLAPPLPPPSSPPHEN